MSITEMTRLKCSSSVLSTAVILSILMLSNAFLAPSSISTTSSQTSRFVTKMNNNDRNAFIDALLDERNDSDPAYKCSHMIAVPLEQSHDLLLELESIQRGILYNCPLLINACIAPVVMRMPLLLVDTETRNLSNGISNDELFGRRSGSGKMGGGLGKADDLLTSRDPVTQELHQIVNQVVHDIIYVQSDETKRISSENEFERDGINEDNIKPIMIKFEKLEIDGDKNEVLHAIGTEDASTPLLRKVLEEITRRIELRGWKAYLPPDEPQGKQGGLNEDGVSWRPRVPFMRLPNDFFETLPDPKGPDGNWENYSIEEKESYIRTPEEGGNGVSPIFWYKWWNDKLCQGNGVRIRELAVYGRTGPYGVTEQGFYLPHLRTKLPDGNKQLQREEQKDKEYDGRRRADQERMMDFDNFDEDVSVNSFEKEIASFKSTADRRMLQTVYDLSSADAAQVGDITESIDMNVPDSASIFETTKELDTDKKEEYTPSNADEIIQSIAKPIASGDWSTLSKKKNKPRPEDNPIFKNWKNRVTMAADTNPSTTMAPLPPYPSDEHFVGIWRLVSAPGSPIMDENEILEAINGDPSSNENLILRIDGTIAGGPILDKVNKHRAAGGSWKFFQAEYIGDDSDDDDDLEPIVQTRLRVRLLIPPSKDKVLVMEGEIKRGDITSAESVSRDNVNELRSGSSFGINKMTINNSVTKSNAYNNDKDILFVTGEAWVEDVSPNGNRSKLGRFSMVKKRMAEKYTYSVLPPQRYQD